MSREIRVGKLKYREIKVFQGNQSREIKVQGNESIGKVKNREMKV